MLEYICNMSERVPFLHLPVKMLFDKLHKHGHAGKEKGLWIFWCNIELLIFCVQEGPVVSFNAATTLRNFCLWQQTQNVLDDAHPSHHDTAVLITRYGLEITLPTKIVLFLSFMITSTSCFLNSLSAIRRSVLWELQTRALGWSLRKLAMSGC